MSYRHEKNFFYVHYLIGCQGNPLFNNVSVRFERKFSVVRTFKEQGYKLFKNLFISMTMQSCTVKSYAQRLYNKHFIPV